MAVTQYIGSRYVPLLASPIEWNVNNSYEALTIVTHEGNSYTSRQFVPVGISIDNDDFWAVTGNYNAQVEAYRRETAGVANQLESVDSHIDSVNDVLSERVDDVNDSLGERIDGVNEEINSRIDGIENILPFDSFTSTHTVKRYVDESNDTQSAGLKSLLVPFPDPNNYPKYGTNGQVLTTLADGTTKWVDPVVPSDAQAQAVITSWLAAHPEATTTVLNGAITPAKIQPDFLQKINYYRGAVTAGSNLNNFQDNGVYSINLSASDYATLVNAPSIGILGGTSGRFLEVIHTSTATDRGIILQRIYGGYNAFTQNAQIVSRYGNYINNVYTWFDWVVESYTAKFIDDTITTINGNFAKTLRMVGSVGRNSDLNSYQNTGVYSINLSPSDYATLSNAPASSILPRTVGLILTVTDTDPRENYGIVTQRITGDYSDGSQNNASIVRYGNRVNDNFTWFDWYVESYSARQVDAKIEDALDGISANRVFRVGPSREYTTILEGVIAAEQYKNSTIYVDPGTYDAVQEFKSVYGNDYFTSSDYMHQPNFRGIPLINGVHVIGYGNVVVTGGLQDTDASDAKTWWSIFNSGDDAGGSNGYGFTLENITVQTLNDNIRYAVHDEYGGTNYDYINKYKNCHFIIASGSTVMCIGGGLGQHGYIEIDNCTVTAPSYPATKRGINYHNNLEAGSLSEVYIKNCYIPDGTVGITWYGSTPDTEKSILYVCNCYLGNAPIKQAETEGSTNENVDIIAWNNEIAN